MDYKITDRTTLEKEIAVTFSAEEVSKSFNEAFTHLSKTVSMNGFRKGKVPLRILQGFYGKNVREETERRFISDAIQEAVTKEKFKLATSPDLFDKGTLTDGKPFEFKFRVEVFPTVNIEIKPYQHEFTPIKFEESMLEKELEAIKARFKEYKESDDAAIEEKDRLLVSFSGKMGDEEVEGASGKDLSVVVGDKQFIPEFEKALYGHKKGDHFTTEVTFPADYKPEKLAGKTLLFTIDITKVEKCVSAPELSDELLAGKAGYPNTLEELKTQIREKIQRYLNDISIQGKKSIAADLYVKEYDFDIPPTLLNNEKNARIAEYKRQYGDGELPADKLAKIEEDARYAIKRYIILNFLADKLDIQVSDQEINAALAQEAINYGLPPEYAARLRKYYNEEKLDRKKYQIREEKVLDKMVEKIVFIEKPVSNEENPNQESEAQKPEEGPTQES